MTITYTFHSDREVVKGGSAVEPRYVEPDYLELPAILNTVGYPLGFLFFFLVIYYHVLYMCDPYVGLPTMGRPYMGSPYMRIAIW